MQPLAPPRPMLPLDIGDIRAALVALGIRTADADRAILRAIAAGADRDEKSVILWCLSHRVR